jgi:hypothetical protein
LGGLLTLTTLRGQRRRVVGPPADLGVSRVGDLAPRVNQPTG